MTDGARGDLGSPTPRRPCRVLLLGDFGTGNVGNDASLTAAVAMVARAAPGAVVTCVCPGPWAIQRALGVSSRALRVRRPSSPLLQRGVPGMAARLGCRATDLARTFISVARHDALLVPGTGILDDYGGERAHGWPLTVLTWLAAARLLGRRTALVGVGAGPFADPRGQSVARWVAGLSTVATVRDEGSLRFLQQAGTTVTDADVVPDVAFSLSHPAPAGRPPAQRPLVVVPVMKYRGWYAADRSNAVADTHVHEITRFCDWLLGTGWAVRLVTADTRDGPTVSRVEAAVRAAAPAASGHLTHERAEDLQQLMRLATDASVVVATRYHSVVAALLCSRPVLSIGYATKNDELMRRVGLGGYCQHIERLDQGLLRRQFLDLVAQQRELAGTVSSRVADLRAELVDLEQRLGREVLRSRARRWSPPRWPGTDRSVVNSHVERAFDTSS